MGRYEALKQNTFKNLDYTKLKVVELVMVQPIKLPRYYLKLELFETLGDKPNGINNEKCGSLFPERSKLVRKKMNVGIF